MILNSTITADARYLTEAEFLVWLRLVLLNESVSFITTVPHDSIYEANQCQRNVIR